MVLGEDIEWIEWEVEQKKRRRRGVKLIIAGIFLIIFVVGVWVASSNSGERMNPLNTGANTKAKTSRVHGQFTLPNPEKKEQEEDWLERHVFQTELRNSLKQWINSIKYLPRYSPFGILVENRHALFYGPPGSGKSYFAGLLGEKESLAYTFANFTGGKYHGSNQERIDEVFQQAKAILASEKNPANKPVMIFVDEIDSIAAKNFSSANNSITSRENNDFLNFINVINNNNDNIIVIGITNYPEELEKAMTRLGRLGSNQFEFFLLTEEEITAVNKSLQEEMEGETRGCYRCPKNKNAKEGKTNDNNQQYQVNWNDDFWAEVEKINREIIRKYQTEKVSFTLAELKKAISETIAKKIRKDSTAIQLDSADYCQEIEKIMKEKIKNYGKKPAREWTTTFPNVAETLKNLTLYQIDELMTNLTKEKTERERERERERLCREGIT